ncbi:LysR substrate-binding domain-containing protein [Paenibacillus hamazuiensis]|uniref:LysR substrate-binding domain-containing protein n=1 Tax=Paenibacillus hamazuiensis TaxID=2936508 RepID=UPI0023DF713A|nr:LysR substrate-binding domain-containing protein [Paenibacillus hamazuiensis]
MKGEEVATVAALVAAGLGISLLPDAGLDKNKLAQIRIREPKSERVIVMVEGRYLPPVASRFKEFVVSYYDRMIPT